MLEHSTDVVSYLKKRRVCERCIENINSAKSTDYVLLVDLKIVRLKIYGGRNCVEWEIP